MSDPRPSGFRLSSTSIAAITLVLVMLAQTVALVSWGSRLDQRVTAVEARMAGDSATSILVNRLDERTNAIVSTVNIINQRSQAQEDAALANQHP